MKIRILLNLTLVGIFLLPGAVLADWKNNLSDNFNEQQRLQGLINSAKDQENTFSNQINLFNNQITLTQLQINDKQDHLNQLNAQVTDLTNKINSLEKQADHLSHVTVTRFKMNQAVEAANPSSLPVTNGSYTDQFSNLAYQSYILYKDNQYFKQLLDLKLDLNTKKTQLASTRDQVKSQRDALASAQSQLNNQKVGQQSLLALTQGSESRYQDQLKQARAAANSLLAFARARVGNGSYVLSSAEYASDGWGTYYNQRDPRWGKIVVTGDSDSRDTIAALGCLITSVAMVWTHYGFTGTTPASIALTPAYFQPGTPGMYFGAAAPPGHSVTYVNNPSNSSIINHLPTGPVVIGISSSIGTHWVVVRGSSGGEMMINDPWEPYAMNVPLSSKYGGWSIFAARFYQ
jgi:peptidoglycan hydrolase CwlO-like protein